MYINMLEKKINNSQRKNIQRTFHYYDTNQ